MSRPVEELEDELSRIWGLVGELSEQLENNRNLVVQLKSRSDNVKGQAAHVGTGFPLRRFNLDISDEEFSSEIEAFSSHLVLENQQLQYENKQLNVLLKEYEQTLESVMGKFRGVAHASQQHDLSLHSYYTSLLQTLQTAHSSAHLHDNTSLSLLLHRLSTLLRSALRALGGEDAEIDLDTHLPGLLALANGEAGPSNRNPDRAESPPVSPTTSISYAPKSIMRKAPQRAPVFRGSLPGASGGYTGTDGQGDWAMEREMEILRLEDENANLREMLRIAQESMEEVLIEDEKEEEGKAEEEEGKVSPTGALTQRRKSSLTMEELQLGAERDDDAKGRVKHEALADAFAKEGAGVSQLKAPIKEVKATSGEAETTPLPKDSALGLVDEPETSGR